MVSRSLTVGAAVREVKPVRYVVRRFGALLVTCWVALTVNFALPRLMPGNPVETMFSRYQG